MNVVKALLSIFFFVTIFETKAMNRSDLRRNISTHAIKTANSFRLKEWRNFNPNKERNSFKRNSPFINFSEAFRYAKKFNEKPDTETEEDSQDAEEENQEENSEEGNDIEEAEEEENEEEGPEEEEEEEPEADLPNTNSDGINIGISPTLPITPSLPLINSINQPISPTPPIVSENIPIQQQPSRQQAMITQTINAGGSKNNKNDFDEVDLDHNMSNRSDRYSPNEMRVGQFNENYEQRVMMLNEQIAKNRQEIQNMRNEIQQLRSNRISTNMDLGSQHRTRRSIAGNLSDSEVAETIIGYLLERDLLDKSKLASINLNEMISGTCLICKRHTFVNKIGDEKEAIGICNSCKKILISNAKRGEFVNNFVTHGMNRSYSYTHLPIDSDYQEGNLLGRSYSTPELGNAYYGNQGVHSQNDLNFTNNGYYGNYNSVDGYNGSYQNFPNNPSGGFFNNLPNSLGGSGLGSLVSSALKNAFSKDEDSNNTQTTTTISVPADQLVMDANGNLVPLSAMQGTDAPYGYVRDANGNLIRATSLAQIVSSNNQVPTVNQAPVVLGTNTTPNNPVVNTINPVSIGTNAVANTQMVMDANGNLVPVSSLQGTNAPFGYIKDANGVMIPDTSLEQAVAAANAVNPATASPDQTTSAQPQTALGKKIAAGVDIAKNASGAVASLASTFSSLKSMLPTKNPTTTNDLNSSVSNLSNNNTTPMNQNTNSGISTTTNTQSGSQFQTNNNNSNTAEPMTSKDKELLKDKYEKLVRQVAVAEKNVKKLEDAKNKAQTTLDKRNDSLSKAKNALTRKIAEKLQQSAQKKFDQAEATYEKEQADLDALIQQRDEAKAELDAANSSGSAPTTPAAPTVQTPAT